MTAAHRPVTQAWRSRAPSRWPARPACRLRSRRQHGMVLVVVLLFVGLLSLSVTVCLYRVRSSVIAVRSSGRNDQAFAAAMSGIGQAMAVLAALGDDPSAWYDQPDLFAARPVAHADGQDWFFTVYSPDDQQPQGVRFGPMDESAKLNLNTVVPAMLAALPLGLTDEQIDALLDYRDADDQPRPNGAEQVFYDGLDRPYLIANGPFTTVEELLMVRGFDGRLVYGEDVNFNGLLDPAESDGQASFPPDNGDGRLDRGLVDYLTTFTTDPQVDSRGRKRQRLEPDPQALARLGLSDQTVQFIVIAMGQGARFEHPAELLKAEFRLKKDEPQAGLTKGQTLTCRPSARELAVMLDRLTVDEQDDRGRLNVNTAPVETLAAVPGLDQNIAQRIVDERAGLPVEQRRTVAWLYTRNLVGAERFKKAAPYLTARSFQYRLRVVGYGLPCRRYAVLEAVIDLSTPARPRLAYVRDLGPVGLPFALTDTHLPGQW